MQHSATRATLSGHVSTHRPRPSRARRGRPRARLGAGIPCQEHDADLWFAERSDDVELAKSLCASCPLRAACLSGALERSEPWGVWGGQIVVNGAIVATKRGPGRPRKDTAA